MPYFYHSLKLKVDKKEFNRLLQTPQACTSVEAQDVLTLKEDYPFSQLLHALSARVSKDQGFSNQKEELQLAAVYASDRNVLKEIVTGEFIPVANIGHTKTPIEKTEIKIISTKTRKTIDPSAHLDSGVAEEVVSDLEKLNQSRHNFEALFNDSGKMIAQPHGSAPSSPAQEAVEVKPEVKKVTTEKPEAKKPPIRKKATGKTKKQRIIELAKKLETENSEPTDSAEDKSPPKKKRKKIVEPADKLIDEIKTSKKKIQPENNRQKEQIELINQFIKAQPSISPQKGKTIPPSTVDFSQPSSDFGDNIISETLVKILISQGKKDKAVEVLRKLIWKFPQKKSYFAAQIEELTK